MSMPSGTTGWNSGGTNNVDPGSAKKILGWVTDEQPASSTFNWIFSIIEAWLVWLRGIYGYVTTWTAAHTFNSTVTISQLLTTNNGIACGGSLAASGVFGLSSGSNSISGNGFVFYYASGGACTADLPANGIAKVGQIIRFINAGGGTLKINPATGDTLNGAASGTGITLNSQYQTMEVVYVPAINAWFGA